MGSSLFIGHGSPMLAIEKSDYSAFLTDLGKQLEKPKAIILFTAHWESEVLFISAIDGVYETIYDFGGFPPELYEITYPAKGSRQIASQLRERFASQGITCQEETKRGLDHGSWVILRRMFPDADVPIVQVSVNPFLPAVEQFKIGQALRGLSDEGILVIGSGATVHNLRTLKWGQSAPEEWAIQFDDWLIDKLTNRDYEALFAYEKEAPHARLAVPRAEHFVPLFIALGSGSEQAVPRVLHRSYLMGTVSNLCMQF